MPECVRCGRVDTTAEMRRRRGHSGEYLCLDGGACSRRVAQPRVDAITAVRELAVRLREVDRDLTAALCVARLLDRPVPLRELAQLAGLSEGDVRRRAGGAKP